MQQRILGNVNGTEIYEITLRSPKGTEAKIMTWGAVVRDLLIPTPAGQQRVVVGFDALEDYLHDTSHAGAIAGRFANRIANGRFELDGQTYQLPLNQDGAHTLHGGGDGQGFSRRPWTLVSVDESSVTLALRSMDGDAGFPGVLDVRCTYQLLDPGTLRIELSATTDAATLCNLASHSYFNLDLPVGFGELAVPSAVDHVFMAHADFYTPVDADLIPTGEICKTAGTPFDFSTPRPLRNAENVKFDLGFVLRNWRNMNGDLVHAATLTGPRTGMALDVFTTEPHLQLYDGGSYSSTPRGHDGAGYATHCGICLEPQGYPDSPNRNHFPDAVLRPEDTYRQVTEYRFRAPKG